MIAIRNILKTLFFSVLFFLIGSLHAGVIDEIEKNRESINILQDDIEIIKASILDISLQAKNANFDKKEAEKVINSNDAKEKLEKAVSATDSAKKNVDSKASDLGDDQKTEIKIALESASEGLDFVQKCASEYQKASQEALKSGDIRKFEEISLYCKDEVKIKETRKNIANNFSKAWEGCSSKYEELNNLNINDKNHYSDIQVILKANKANFGCARDIANAAGLSDKGLQETAAVFDMASEVCMASGGNPYVCGGAAVLALIMLIFGDGDGEGEGDGKDSDAGHGREGEKVVVDNVNPNEDTEEKESKDNTKKITEEKLKEHSGLFNSAEGGDVECKVVDNSDPDKLSCGGKTVYLSMTDPKTKFYFWEASETLIDTKQISELLKKETYKIGLCSQYYENHLSEILITNKNNIIIGENSSKEFTFIKTKNGKNLIAYTKDVCDR